MHFRVGVWAENEAVRSEGDIPSSSLRDWGDALLELTALRDQGLELRAGMELMSWASWAGKTWSLD